MTSNAITLITTGGTIGSTSEEDSVNVSRGEQLLQQHIAELCERNQLAIKTRAAFNKNSEDLAPADWLTLINVIADEIAQGSDRIIITHGTDTMAFSAAALALCFGQQAVKIVLTGSCFTLEHPESDVSANLLGALASAAESNIANGVYVSFLNDEKQVQVIDALTVKPMIFDELSFQAQFRESLGVFNQTLTVFTAHSYKPKTLSASINPADIRLDLLTKAEPSVVQISCYPGMSAVPLCAALAKGCCVIVNLYHSGTGPSTLEKNGLLEAIRSRPDLTFLLAALPSRHIPKPYQATMTLMKAGARLYQDIQPHILYTLITLGLASGRDLDDLLSELAPYQQSISA